MDLSGLDPKLIAEGVAAGHVVGSAVKEAVLKPVGDVLGAHVKAFAEQRFGPVLQRVLPLREAAKVAAADVTARLADVPPELLVAPAPAVAAGVVEALQTRADVPELRAMFAELLANACRQDRADVVHIAFIEIIRQLEPEDARVLATVARQAELIDGALIPVRSVSGMIAPTRRILVQNAGTLAVDAGRTSAERGVFILGNLERLGLLASAPTGYVDDRDPYNVQLVVELTSFGERLTAACLPNADAALRELVERDEHDSAS